METGTNALALAHVVGGEGSEQLGWEEASWSGRLRRHWDCWPSVSSTALNKFRSDVHSQPLPCVAGRLRLGLDCSGEGLIREEVASGLDRPDEFWWGTGEVLIDEENWAFFPAIVVALHPSSPEKLLNELMQSDNEYVRAALVQRPFQPGFERFALDHSHFVRSWLATVPTLSEILVQRLLADPDERVRTLAALHPKATIEGRVMASLLGVASPRETSESLESWLRLDYDWQVKGIFSDWHG